MDGTNWYVYCTGNPIAFVDPWGLEYGSINTFANDLTQIYGGTPTIWYYSDDSFTVTVGSGAFGKTGTFYQNGYARLLKDHTGRGGYYIAKVGENKNGTLYMKRTDFYEAMGVNYSVASQEIEIKNDPAGGIARTIVVGALVSPAGAGASAIASSAGVSAMAATGIGTVVTGALDYFVNSVLSKDSLEDGNYRVEYIVGEIYNMASECYESVLTISYYQLGTNGDGEKTEQLKASITKYNGRFSDSILQ